MPVDPSQVELSLQRFGPHQESTTCLLTTIVRKEASRRLSLILEWSRSSLMEELSHQKSSPSSCSSNFILPIANLAFEVSEFEVKMASQQEFQLFVKFQLSKIPEKRAVAKHRIYKIGNNSTSVSTRNQKQKCERSQASGRRYGARSRKPSRSLGTSAPRAPWSRSRRRGRRACAPLSGESLT